MKRRFSLTGENKIRSITITFFNVQHKLCRAKHHSNLKLFCTQQILQGTGAHSDRTEMPLFCINFETHLFYIMYRETSRNSVIYPRSIGL
jgi:hypothetical protein